MDTAALTEMIMARDAMSPQRTLTTLGRVVTTGNITSGHYATITTSRSQVLKERQRELLTASELLSAFAGTKVTLAFCEE